MLSANKLSLNISKTNYIFFKYWETKAESTWNELAYQVISNAESAKFLYVDGKLKWDTYINMVTKRVTRSLFTTYK